MIDSITVGVIDDEYPIYYKKDLYLGQFIYCGKTEYTYDLCSDLYGVVIGIYDHHALIQTKNYTTSVNFHNENEMLERGI